MRSRGTDNDTVRLSWKDHLKIPGFWSTKIETLANLATIFVAALLSVVLLRFYFLPRPWVSAPLATASAEHTSLRTNLTDRLPGVDWMKNGRTIVLALSTRCHFCTESAPFFRKLREKAGKNVKIVGAFPQPVAEAELYLKGEGVHVDQVKQITLANIGVSGTPTVLLLDSAGIVTNSWVGKLQPVEEDQVLTTVVGSHSAAADENSAAKGGAYTE